MKVSIGEYLECNSVYNIIWQLYKFGIFTETFVDNIYEKIEHTKFVKFIDNIFRENFNRRNRKVSVKIDNYDIWNLDETLSIIILPALKALRDDKQGYPLVDDSDVPDSIKSMNAPRVVEVWDTDEFSQKRWEYVLDEIIWAFEQVHPDSDWESQYHSGVSDIRFVPCEDNPNFSTMVRTEKDTHEFDSVGYKKHLARIRNGLMLFGKYYLSMWV